MMTKKQAIEFAKQFNWTEADAKRAFSNLNLKEANEQDILIVLAEFSGQELLTRQQLQAAQKGQVTKKKNEIRQIETEYQQQIAEYQQQIAEYQQQIAESQQQIAENQQQIAESQQQIKEMQSVFIPIIARLYSISKQFGLQDPWIEAILETELTPKLFRTNLKLDKWLNKSKHKLDTLKTKYDPRSEFNRWRNSQEEKGWKKQKYYQQNKRCPICEESIYDLKGSHIDHIKPLAYYPHLALDTNNMRITHAECNNLRGTKID